MKKKDINNDEYVQISLKRRIKRFDDDAIESMMAQYAQLDDKKGFDPLIILQLNRDENTKSLSMISLIKKKRMMRLKVE